MLEQPLLEQNDEVFDHSSKDNSPKSFNIRSELSEPELGGEMNLSLLSLNNENEIEEADE